MTWATAKAAMHAACRDTFGSAGVVYTPALTGIAATITGVHDVEYLLVDGGNGAPVSAQSTWLDVVLVDLLAAPLSGDSVTIAAVAYQVGHVEADGQGMARLHLLKV